MAKSSPIQQAARVEARSLRQAYKDAKLAVECADGEAARDKAIKKLKEVATELHSANTRAKG